MGEEGLTSELSLAPLQEWPMLAQQVIQDWPTGSWSEGAIPPAFYPDLPIKGVFPMRPQHGPYEV